MITCILSFTFSPPIITKNGFSGVSIIFEKLYNYFANKKPAARIGKLIPAIELCALCAVPNASLIYISPNDVNDFLNFSISYFLAFTFLPFNSLDPSY